MTDVPEAMHITVQTLQMKYMERGDADDPAEDVALGEHRSDDVDSQVFSRAFMRDWALGRRLSRTCSCRDAGMAPRSL